VRNWLQQPNTAGATFIDLFSGPGRVRIRDSSDVLDGSPLVAWQQSVSTKAQFTQVYVADAHPALADAAAKRLSAVGAPVHFAFLDPFSLGVLPFEVIRKLARLKRMDILIHVSVQDRNRNLRKCTKKSASQLDTFAPGCVSTLATWIAQICRCGRESSSTGEVC
jgi:hypothetical protein